MKYKNKGFGLLGLLFTVAIIGVSAYIMLQSFNRDAELINPTASGTTTPIQAAHNASNLVEEHTANLHNVINQAQNIVNKGSY